MITQVIPQSYQKTEVGIVPNEWSVKRLDESFVISAGRDLIKNAFSLNSDDNHPFPIYSNSLENGGIYGYSSIPRYKKNTITITARGSVGKANARIIDYDAIGRLLVLEPKNKLNCFFVSEFINNVIKFSIESTGVPQLTAPQASKYFIALPSEVEQTAIATTLSDIDSLITSLQKLIDKKKMIKQGAMQELLTGKRRLPGFDGEWVEVKLVNIAEFFKGKGLPKKDITVGGEFDCIHYGELFTDYPEKINKIHSHTNNKTNTIVSKSNDVLMPTSDVTPNGLAKASCIPFNNVILGGDILIIRLNDSYNGIFLSYMIRFDKYQVLQLVSGSTVYHLYASDMKKFTFSAPELDEQIAIVNVLSDMELEIRKMELKLSKLKSIKQGAMQQLLTGKIRLL